MKNANRLAFAVAAQLCCLALSGAQAQAPDSLPLGWVRADTLLASFHSLHLDRQVKHGGASSLRIHTTRPGSNIDYENLAHFFRADDYRGKRIRLTGHAKLADTTGAAGFLITVTGSAQATPFDHTLFWRPLRGPGEWQRQELVMDVPTDAAAIRIGVLFRGPGTAWFDDLAIEPVDTTVPTTGRVMPAGRFPTSPASLSRVPLNLDFEPHQLAVVKPSVFTRTEAMIPMRDGTLLFTTIASPRVASEPLPILLGRTPYGARPQLYQGMREGYIVVSQDIRGRNRSKGAFVMNRPVRDARNVSTVDETTDAYDTVEWLIRNVPNNNGRVGVIGLSYDGWLAEVVLLDPHPAVKAVSPQAPMTDTWMGDDFFHQGAFRQQYGLSYSWGMEGQQLGLAFPNQGDDLYAWYLRFGSVKAMTDSLGFMRIPTWRRFVEHPAYDAEWQGRAFQQLVKRNRVPTLNVGGWWDQEDILGPQATYRALERLDSADVNVLVLGPWYHTQWAGPGGASLGNLRFGTTTADTFLLKMQAPWFACWLKTSGPCRFPEAQLFDAGADTWRTLDAWPPREAMVRRLYFHPGGRLSFNPPRARTGFDAYVSDPATPVPYVPRPVGYDIWSRWLTDDQRFASSRADVLTWQTEPLAEDVTIAGDVTARLFAATTGSDADWVVKLIDVYPNSFAERPAMGGYQLMVAGDIMRGRYRRSFEQPEAIQPNAVESYTVDMHQQLYTFRRGHRIMVQVQSSWFPLYDRNPQTFVPNIFLAPASAYRAQTHRIHRAAGRPSYVQVLVLAK